MLGGSWVVWPFDVLDATISGLVMLAIANTFSVGLRDIVSTAAWFLLVIGIGRLFLDNIVDRIGCKKTILASVFTYGTGTLLCGFAPNVFELNVCRFCVGVAMDGLWSAASVLVSGIWTPEGRARAIAFMQTGWSGDGLLAACFAWMLLDPSNPDSWYKPSIYASIPTYVTFAFILLFVKESPVWLTNRTYKAKHMKKSSLFETFRPAYLKMTLLSLSISIFGMYEYWIITTFTPTYLQGILHVCANQAPALLTWTDIGATIGYLAYGQFAELIGRRKSFALFFLDMAIMVLVFAYGATLIPLTDGKLTFTTRSIVTISVLATLLGFSIGYSSGLGAWYSELFPTSIRSTTAGFCFSFGRAGAILGIKLMPILIPLIGFTATIPLASVFYLIASVMVFLFQEIKDARFTSDN